MWLVVELIPRLCKIFSLVVELTGITSVSTKCVSVTVEFEVPKDILWGLNYMIQHGFAMGEAKRFSNRKMEEPMARKWCYNIYIEWNVCWGGNQDKRRQWNRDTLFYLILKSIGFGHLLKWINTLTFEAWSYLLVHIRFTPSRRAKDFVYWFFKEIGSWMLDHQVGPWKKAIFQGPISWYMV